MSKLIRVAIVDDHPLIVDGMLYRLTNQPDIEVAWTSRYGGDLEERLAKDRVDVLLLDLEMPTSPQNPNPFPILHMIPKLLEAYPCLSILVVSMFSGRALIQKVMDAGASGYVIKDDAAVILELASEVRKVAEGGICLSKRALNALMKSQAENLGVQLSPRQQEIISLAASYPDRTAAELAKLMDVEHSTARNLLSGTYMKLGVHGKAAAIAEAKRLGLVPQKHEPDIREFGARD